MTRFASLAKAGKAALEGENESQDSQAILEAYKAEFGVGTLSSSPPIARATEPENKLQHIPQSPRPGVPGSTGIHGPPAEAGYMVGSSRPAATAKEQATANEATMEAPMEAVVHTSRDHLTHQANVVEQADKQSLEQPPSADTQENVHDDTKAWPSVGSAVGARFPVPKMDVSQQTPTQVNDERDYTAYCDTLQSSPTEAPTQQHNSVDEPRTLEPDDTGAVNFGNLSEFARPSSQVSEDGGFENTRGEWRHPDGTSQQMSNVAFTPYKQNDLPPETPAFPKNPFGAKSNAAVPWAGTQLFGQTQMLSSAVKVASPTSSRPSPNIYLNSISPNIMETSPLKDRANVSSPTDIRTSSPTRLHEVPATLLKDKSLSAIAEETPVPRRSPKDEMVPESPTFQAAKSSSSRQPLASYEPMKQSQERKTTGNIRALYLDEDTDSDDAMQQLDRRRRVERKRALAAQEMGRVSFTPLQRALSDNQLGSRKRRKTHNAEDLSAPGPDDGAKYNAIEPPLVRDSQKATSQSVEVPSLESTKATPGEGDMEIASAIAQREPVQLESTGPEPVDEDMIPATSPIRSSPALHRREAPSASEPDLPTLRKDNSEESGHGQNAESSSLPPVRRRSQRTYGKRNRDPKSKLAVVSSAEEPTTVEEEIKAQSTSTPEASNAISNGEHPTNPRRSQDPPPSSYSEPPVRMGTRSRRTEKQLHTPRASRVTNTHLLTSSSLTNLSGTPEPSAKTTPGTQESGSSERAGSSAQASPNGSTRTMRKRDSRLSPSLPSPQLATKAKRVSRRSLRVDSDATEEPTASPSASALDRSTNVSRSGRSFRQSLGPASRKWRLFDGMLFATSFSDNNNERTRLESKITQAGGTIVEKGFQELFEQSAIITAPNATVEYEDALQLSKSNVEYGFTALLADGHSRKPKYMQALAMGLPCLAPQWVTTCLSRGELVDWAPYLLCAGPSQILGNAIRSRILQPYNPLDAKLTDILDTRDRLMDGERVLVLVDHKKSRQEAKRHYLFLALALGPSFVSRVSTINEAGETLRKAEQDGLPYGWLYVDASSGTMDTVLAAAQKTRGKKRKKGVPASASIGQYMRELTDELMIQSLILGRMVEWDEMSF